jgi:hypothetical protein
VLSRPLTRSLLLVIGEHEVARPNCNLDHSFCSPNWLSAFGKLFFGRQSMPVPIWFIAPAVIICATALVVLALVSMGAW